jgi:hypothetical protein
VTTLVAIVPSIGALFLFWVALRAILQADRRERLAVARADARQDRTQAQKAAAADVAGAEPAGATAAGPADVAQPASAEATGNTTAPPAPGGAE